VDECHIARKQTSDFIKNNPDTKVVGLTATPFTKGLGESVLRTSFAGATNGWLVDNRWPYRLKVFIAKEIDMTGAKKAAGSGLRQRLRRGASRLREILLRNGSRRPMRFTAVPERRLCFALRVGQLGRTLSDGLPTRVITLLVFTYRDNDEFKRQAIEDFAKPDTEINGLIATDILTRGFDVPDVMIGVSARALQ
jgi:superfamily II DNA or RNA helicase